MYFFVFVILHSGFFKSGNYLAAVNAYNLAARLDSKMHAYPFKCCDQRTRIFWNQVALKFPCLKTRGKKRKKLSWIQCLLYWWLRISGCSICERTPTLVFQIEILFDFQSMEPFQTKYIQGMLTTITIFITSNVSEFYPAIITKIWPYPLRLDTIYTFYMKRILCRKTKWCPCFP